MSYGDETQRDKRSYLGDFGDIAMEWEEETQSHVVVVVTSVDILSMARFIS